MAFWDDVISFFTGGSSSSSKSNQSSRPEPGTRSRSGGDSFGQSQRRDSSQSSYTPAVLSGENGVVSRGGGGGGRGGMVSMSMGAPVAIRTRTQTETPTATPTPSPSSKDSSEPKKTEYNIWDDLGAWFTSPADGNIFTTPIAGAAQRKAESQDTWNRVMGEGNLDEDGKVKVPTNDQLRELGRDDDTVNVDGDLIPLNNSPDYNQTLRKRAEAADTAAANAAFLKDSSVSGVRELTPEEWDRLTPEQQQSVTANYALYQAAQRDRELSDKEMGDEAYANSVASLFGEDRGSERYAPNTVRVLEELGISNERLDLDHFLDGRAFIQYGDLFGGTQNEDRQSLIQSYGDAEAFDSQSIQKSLEAGATLLDAVRNSAATSQTSRYAELAGAASGITDTTELDTVFGNLASRSVLEQAKADQSINDQLTAQIEEVNQKYGPEVVAAYFRQAAERVTDTVNFMGGDEFINQWIGE